MRVFYVISGFENGGVEMLLERWIAAMPQETEFHVVAHEIVVPACAERIRALGVEIHLIPCRKQIGRHKRALRALFRQYRPDILHVHTTEWGFLALGEGKRCGVPVRIQHSHAAFGKMGPCGKLSLSLRFRLGRVFATDYMACGKAAAETAFGERIARSGQVTVLQNGIDVEKYRYDATLRQAARRALGLSEEALAVGMVARFSPQKDHAAALRIFKEFHRRHPQAVLLLVGEGETRPRAEAQAAKILPQSAVRFLGAREDVPALLSAFDRFLLTSRFEGFPITLVEAQSAGLPCVVADTVSPEVVLTDLVKRASTADTAAFCAALEEIGGAPRESYAEQVLAAGFSLADAAERLYRFYQSKTES